MRRTHRASGSSATALVCSVLAVSGCSSPQQSAAPVPLDAGALASDAAGPNAERDPIFASRPYELREPANQDGAPAALLIGLHGYGEGDNAAAFEKWLKLSGEASKRGYLYALPSGTLDEQKNPFWNATDACCNFYESSVDDVAYIAALIEDVARTHALDRDRVYVVGVSGGGIMAHRLACDLSDRIAAIVSVSGATWQDASRCQPSAPVAIVEMHGDADDVVAYEGGALPVPGRSGKVPGARTTVERWKSRNGCRGALEERAGAPPLDLESTVPGSETHVETYEACDGAATELWTAKGGPHAPLFTKSFVPTIFDFLQAHPKAR